MSASQSTIRCYEGNLFSLLLWGILLALLLIIKPASYYCPEKEET